MPTNPRHPLPPAEAACQPSRLAESGVVKVDACDCGVLQLHFGAVTLRLAPCAVVDVVTTLERALAAEEARHVARC